MASSQEIPQPSIPEIIWKMMYLKFHSNFSWVNELTAVTIDLNFIIVVYLVKYSTAVFHRKAFPNRFAAIGRKYNFRLTKSNKESKRKLQCLCHYPVYDTIIPGLTLGMHPANERRCYFVATSLIGAKSKISPAILIRMTHNFVTTCSTIIVIGSNYCSCWGDLSGWGLPAASCHAVYIALSQSTHWSPGMWLGYQILYAVIVMSMSQDPFDDKSTLVQVMAWCLKAPSHYQSRCWQRPTTPCDNHQATLS